MLEGALDWLDDMMLDLTNICLRAEDSMTSATGVTWFELVYQIFFAVGISMIVIKFLKRGFECYVGWTEGDPDADPLQLVVNFIKAIAVAVCFPVLYDFLVDGVQEITGQVIGAIGDATAAGLATIITTIVTGGISLALMALVFFIMFFILWVQFLARGLEIVVLRCGMPWACMGLIDSDKGVFGTYLKRLFQAVLTVIVQVALVKLGMAMMVGGHGFWAIAALMMSMKTPKLLQDFLMGYGAGGLMAGVHHTTSVIQSIRRAAVRGKAV